MATKLDHKQALTFVYANVDEKTMNTLSQKNITDEKALAKIKEARKALNAAITEAYNNTESINLCAGSTLRSLAHLLATQKKIDEKTLVSSLFPNDKVTSLIDTEDRLATYLATAVNAAIDKTTEKKTTTNVDVAKLKKMFALTNDVSLCAKFFDITEDNVNKLLSK